MMLFPYLELIAALFTLLFAFDIYTRHYENRSAHFFARFALIALIASILEYSLRIAFTLNLAFFISRLSASFWLFVFPAFAHFCLIFTGKESFLKKKIALPILYLPSAILSLLFLFTNLMHIRADIYHFGIAIQPTTLYWAFTANTVIYSILGIILLFLNSINNPQKIVRSQSLLIMFGALFPTIIGVITDEILPITMGYRPMPPTCVIDVAIMIFFIYLAMRKYALFAISPALAADIIIETMPDSLIVTDLEGRVIFLNEDAHKFFKVPKEEIIGSPIGDLFFEKDKCQKLYDEIVYNNLTTERYAADLVTPLGEKIPSLINASKIKDSLGASLGIVYIIRDIRG